MSAIYSLIKPEQSAPVTNALFVVLDVLSPLSVFVISFQFHLQHGTFNIDVVLVDVRLSIQVRNRSTCSHLT